MTPKRHTLRFALAGLAVAGLSAVLLPGCRAAERMPLIESTTRLNLPSGIEPAKDAPKLHRAPKHYDPDFERHPARWRQKLRARYA